MNEDKLNKSFLTTEAKEDINEMLGRNEGSGSIPKLKYIRVDMEDIHVTMPSTIQANSIGSVSVDLYVKNLTPYKLYGVFSVYSHLFMNGLTPLGEFRESLIVYYDPNAPHATINFSILFRNDTNADISITDGSLYGYANLVLMECETEQ